jgi:hypothetical protein
MLNNSDVHLDDDVGGGMSICVEAHVGLCTQQLDYVVSA